MPYKNSIELLLKTLWQSYQEYLSDFLRTSGAALETRNFVLFMLTCPLLSMPDFIALALEIHSSWVFTMSTWSSAQRSFYTTPVWNPREMHQDEGQWIKVLMHISSHAKPFTVLNVDPYTTLDIGLHALDDTQPNHRRRGPQDPPQGLPWQMVEDFLKIDEAGLLTVMYFSCNWRRMKMASVQPPPGIKLNRILSMLTMSGREKSSTSASSFMIWSVRLRQR